MKNASDLIIMLINAREDILEYHRPRHYSDDDNRRHKQSLYDRYITAKTEIDYLFVKNETDKKIATI